MEGEMQSQPFSLLQRLFGDPVMAEIFSAEQSVRYWLAVEAALAQAQAAVDVISERDATLIVEAAVLDNVDLDELWREARNVGYPILPLVRMISAVLPDPANGRVHYGATTQDIMDTGLALQLRASLDRLDELAVSFGDALVTHMDAHRHTVLPARTHAQQAVPTTFGTKLAVFLAELARHRTRLAAVRERACKVSLHGAGGTSAAFGPAAVEVRRAVADRLGLAVADVPWHVARDTVAEFGLAAAGLAATCARFGREVIDLSRTEIAEVAEQDGHHRGASSTMPQKVNPIGSEAVIGMACAAGASASALLRAMEAGHERSAGEWQIEWEVVPLVATLVAGAVRTAGEVATGLQPEPLAMRANLERSRGLIMAEAYMMRLAPEHGRERAHDLVYEAAQLARQGGLTLLDALARGGHELTETEDGPSLQPDRYVGQPDLVCDSALELWRESVREGASP
jgi:3-carboxy-cis,cis-muconate cycloisomerase